MAKLEGFHDSDTTTDGNFRVLGCGRSDWKEKRTLWFCRCHDTKKLIWPFTKVYCSSKVKVKMANQMKIEADADARWITPSAYTYRVLTKLQK